MHLVLNAVAAAAITFSAPALAQAAIAPGMQVTDTAGGLVGNVAAVQGDNVLVKTDKHEVLLSKTSFTVSGGKVLFGMTRAELNAKVDNSLAAADAAIVAGAVVKGGGGSQLGTIDSVEADGVVIALSSGQKIQIARSSLRGNADGTVTTGLTAEQLQASIGSAPSDQAVDE